MPIIAKKWRKVLFSYEHDWMATDPRFLTEQSVNMYFEIFKLFPPARHRMVQSSDGKEVQSQQFIERL